MQNAPDTNTMNKKIKFLGKGAKFHVQAQKTSKVDFIWRIWWPIRESREQEIGGGGGGGWVSCFSKVLETFQAQMQILKSKPVE